MAKHAGAAEIALVAQVQIAARANGATKASGDFVIAQVDVGTAARAIGRGRRVADLMLSLAFETRNDAILLPAPNVFQLSMKRNFLYGAGFFLEFQSRLRS